MFPFSPSIQLHSDLKIDYKLVLQHIGPLLTEHRRQTIDKVVAHRTFRTAVVLESIYDRGNISAVMRSSEAFGFAPLHIIETQNKFKESQRVTKGADKWLEVKKWKSTSESIQTLKQQGYKICVTALAEEARPVQSLDWDQPVAVVFGNEKNGASSEMIQAADELILLPMVGFVQSFNISVAAALVLYHIHYYKQLRNIKSELSLEQQDILKAHYYMRTQDSAVDYLTELYSRQILS